MGGPSPGPPPRLFRFGVYEADVRSGELRKNGVRLKLQQQPFQVLLELLQRPNDVVTREELRKALWLEDTFVDFDHSLNTAINKLRVTLNDSGDNPRFIETLARRGYRFIAPVTRSLRVTLNDSGDNPRFIETLARRGYRFIAPVTVAEPGVAAIPAASAPVVTTVTTAHELPRPPRRLVRYLFALAQLMYLILYVVALAKLGSAEREIGNLTVRLAFPLTVLLLVLAIVGIPVRLYTLFAVLFDYRALAPKFRRIFPALIVLDQLWALTPLLLASRIGLGLAFAAAAGLLYLPFSQRTLVRMGYE